MNKIIVTILATIAFAGTASADSMTFQFKNPSFSGQGYSNHVLAIEQLQANRKQALKDEAEARLRPHCQGDLGEDLPHEGRKLR